MGQTFYISQIAQFANAWKYYFQWIRCRGATKIGSSRGIPSSWKLILFRTFRLCDIFVPSTMHRYHHSARDNIRWMFRLQCLTPSQPCPKISIYRVQSNAFSCEILSVLLIYQRRSSLSKLRAFGGGTKPRCKCSFINWANLTHKIEKKIAFAFCLQPNLIHQQGQCFPLNEFTEWFICVS